MLNLNYIAAVFDESSSLFAPTGLAQVRLNLYVKSRTLADEIVAEYGGCVFPRADSHQVQLASNKRVETFLSAIQPHSRHPKLVQTALDTIWSYRQTVKENRNDRDEIRRWFYSRKEALTRE